MNPSVLNVLTDFSSKRSLLIDKNRIALDCYTELQQHSAILIYTTTCVTIGFHNNCRAVLNRPLFRERKKLSDVDYESLKQYCLRKRIERFDSISAGHRQNTPILIYWRKGIFALNRKCICGELFTLSHSERCFGTYLPMEDMIEKEEYLNVEHYLSMMWNTMHS
jgi:hypothetical protein